MRSTPITFTSGKDQKAAGDWHSLYFSYFPTTGNHISYAKIEYAGAESTTTGFGCGPTGKNNDAVFISGQGANDAGPDTAFIDNTTFDNIGGNEVITSGWTGDGPNFATGNTFGASTPGCHVSQPRVPGPGDYCRGRLNICW